VQALDGVPCVGCGAPRRTLRAVGVAGMGASPSTSMEAGGASSVEDLQNMLVAWGFNPGRIDNAWGPNTSGAVNAFVQAHGRDQAMYILGAQWVSRAGVASEQPSSHQPPPQPSEPPPAPDPSTPPAPGGTTGGGLTLTQLLQMFGGGAGSGSGGGAGSSGAGGGGGGGSTGPLTILTNPVFLGMIGLGVIGAVLVAGQMKKSKGKK